MYKHNEIQILVQILDSIGVITNHQFCSKWFAPSILTIQALHRIERTRALRTIKPQQSEQRIIYEIQQNPAHFWNSSHMTIWPLNQSIIHYWMLLLITLLLLWVGTCPCLLFIRPLPCVVVSDRVAFNTLLVPHKRLSLSDLRIGPACRSTISQIWCELNSS